MRVNGHCHCGRIRFQAEVDPDTVTICHCTDCQRLTGSLFRANIAAPAASFAIEGTPKIYVKTAESGAKRAHAFCPDCGTPIYAAAVENPASYSLRVGTLDERASFTPARRIWCRSALDWPTDLGAVPTFEKGAS